MTEFVIIGEIVLVPGPQGVPGPNTVPTNEVIAAALVPYTKTADLAAGPLAPYAKTADIPLTAAGYFGNLVVGDGDSITIAGTDSTFRIFADSWYTYVCAFSDGRMPYVFNAGHGGYSSADLVALLNTEVIAKVPRGGRVIWAAGRNDQQTLESTKAADRAVLEKCRKAGIDVVFTTLVPVGMTPLDTPAAPVATYSNASGTLAAGTYAYKVVARNANGATLPSPAASITTSAVGRVGLTWAHIQGATGYDIYRDDLKIGASSLAAGRPVPAFTDTGLSGAGAPPSSNTTGKAPGNAADAIFTAKVNAWRKRVAAVSGSACIDFYRVLADPTTGYYRKGLTADGVHPTPEAQRLMGTEAWATMSKVVPDVRGYVTEDQANPLNLYPNGLFLTGGGNPVDRPNGFGGTAAGTTTSLATVAGFKGNAWSLERTTPAANTYNGELFGGINLAAAGVSVGDLIQFAVRVQKTGSETGGMIAEIEVAFTGGAARLGMWRLSADVADPTTLVSPPVAVPANTTALSVKVNTFGGIGKLTLGQLTIVDLTTAGLIV